MLDDFQSCLGFAVGAGIVQGFGIELLNSAVVQGVRKKAWWPRARPLQAALMRNVGYTEEQLTDEVCLDTYSEVICVCVAHLVAGMGVLPVIVLGWEEAGPAGQALLKIGVLTDVGFDLYDRIKATLLCFFHDRFARWGSKEPLSYFLIMTCLHHPLAMTASIPMVMYHASMPAFHRIAAALLLATAICYLSGSYKFTLDTTTRKGMMQFKAIVVMQAVVIVYSRCYIWFGSAWELLRNFRENGETAFLVGASVVALLMTLFNLILIQDALMALLKWLPKPMPSAEEDHEPQQALQLCRAN